MDVPLALSPLVPPGLGPVNLLTAVTSPFHVHPPPSYAMLVGHSRLALNWHISVVKRSVTTPHHGRGHGPRFPWLLGVVELIMTVVRKSKGPRPGGTYRERASGMTTKILSRWFPLALDPSTS